MVTPREAGGYGLDAQWSDDFHHALHVALTGETTGYYTDFEPLSALVKVCENGFFHDGTWSSFRETEHGRPVDTAQLPTWRLVVTDQNHDQVGNRARGDRLSDPSPGHLDDDQLACAALLTICAPFTPMLFMGEEWAASTRWPFFTSPKCAGICFVAILSLPGTATLVLPLPEPTVFTWVLPWTNPLATWWYFVGAWT